MLQAKKEKRELKASLDKANAQLEASCQDILVNFILRRA